MGKQVRRYIHTFLNRRRHGPDVLYHQNGQLQGKGTYKVDVEGSFDFSTIKQGSCCLKEPSKTKKWDWPSAFYKNDVTEDMIGTSRIVFEHGGSGT